MSHSPEPWNFGAAVVTDAQSNIVMDIEVVESMQAGDIERIVACVNACRCIPTEVIGPVMDKLFTAMMTAEAISRKSDTGSSDRNMVFVDCVSAATILKRAGVDLTELLKQCSLKSPGSP